jgi:hypothetical protein
MDIYDSDPDFAGPPPSIKWYTEGPFQEGNDLDPSTRLLAMAGIHSLGIPPKTRGVGGGRSRLAQRDSTPCCAWGGRLDTCRAK